MHEEKKQEKEKRIQSIVVCCIAFGAGTRICATGVVVAATTAGAGTGTRTCATGAGTRTCATGAGSGCDLNNDISSCVSIANWTD
jgi:hypothetical protein